MPPSILVVTGASGAGKTATVAALDALALPGVRCFHFDTIGVPTPEAMERDYGGPERWQAWATDQWMTRLAALDDGTRVAVLDAQTRPSTVLASPGARSARGAHVVLLDCTPEVRAARLRGPRGQPELDTARMDGWAAYLRGQADALGLLVIDSSALTVAEAAERLAALVQRMPNDLSSARQEIARVALVVRDYDEAIGFYTGTLGFTLVEDTYQPEQDKRWVIVAPAGSRGATLLLARASTAEQERCIGNQTGGRVFLFLRTDDFWRDYHRLTTAGVRFVRPPSEASYGTVAVFEDLYGNRWDLIEHRVPARAGAMAASSPPSAPPSARPA